MHEQVREFRSSQMPITARWLVDGHPYFGVLVWRDGTPFLELTFEYTADRQLGLRDVEHPLLRATKPHCGSRT